ncbi:leucine-rich repeat neuronal protein 1-like [Aedes albopictus]|uniref:Leucine-rich repeat protein n=1 Tax=Aedes albopictus TaxID=7160 RepID=A0ABM1Z1N8_AEDAL
MKEIVVLLLIIATLCGTKSFSVQNWQHNPEIRNFHWPADAVLMGNIPDKERLDFKNIEADILPQNFTNQFRKCSTTIFYYGNIKTIHINPKLMHIRLYSTSTENVIIESGNYYQLKEFVCKDAKLTHIPENVSQLKKLRYMSFENNLIQTVQLDQFNGLDYLHNLDLSSNKINHIYNHGSVSLPSLENLHLGGNQLKHFDVCSWNMPNLYDLNLFSNELTHFSINHFRSLEIVNLAENPLNCVWKNSLLSNKPDMRIEEPLACDRNNKGVFGLDCPFTIDQLQQQNSNFDSRLAQIEETVMKNNQQFSELGNRVQKFETEMNKKFQKMEQLLIHLSKKIVEQQNVANDIIEAIYRAEIERTYNSKQKP